MSKGAQVCIDAAAAAADAVSTDADTDKSNIFIHQQSLACSKCPQSICQIDCYAPIVNRA